MDRINEMRKLLNEQENAPTMRVIQLSGKTVLQYLRLILAAEVIGLIVLCLGPYLTA